MGMKTGQKTDGARANYMTSYFVSLFTCWTEELTSSVFQLRQNVKKTDLKKRHKNVQ